MLITLLIDRQINWARKRRIHIKRRISNCLGLCKWLRTAAVTAAVVAIQQLRTWNLSTKVLDSTERFPPSQKCFLRPNTTVEYTTVAEEKKAYSNSIKSSKFVRKPPQMNPPNEYVKLKQKRKWCERTERHVEYQN